MIKLLIGGSPCTYWSVAQKKGREVEAKGLGWELFKNYLIAKEKFKPDLFLYENNKIDAEEQPKPSATTDCQCVTVVDVLLDLRDERLRLSQINGKNRRYGDEVRALEYAIDILEAVT